MKLKVDLNKPPKSIAIPLDFDGPQPNHFGADKASAAAMKSGSFVGDTRLGGSCNAQNIYLNPHCNGTHTESISHVINELVPPHQVILQPMMLACLISLTPVLGASCEREVDSYQPPLKDEDWVLDLKQFTAVIKTLHKNIKALIIRTLPNTSDKLSYRYGEQIQPPFFSNEVMQWLVNETHIEHLLVDMPSVDRLHDEGLLSNHRIFWNIMPGSHESTPAQHNHKTITEMVFVPDHIDDGEYMLNLQVPRLNLNAVPSNPVLYQISERP